MNTIKNIIKRIHRYYNKEEVLSVGNPLSTFKDYTHNYHEIDQIGKNDHIKSQLIQALSMKTWLSYDEIEAYSESQVLDSCSESSTVKCQLQLLNQLYVNEYLRTHMELYVTQQNEDDILKKRLDAEYMTALYHLKKNNIYPSSHLSKHEIISMYSSFRKKISTI